jgi:VIT1/CCC1 family predicted Fe2+/Mn2+ transporter
MYTLGVIFTLRVFEKLEAHSRQSYKDVIDEIDELKDILKDEKTHEEALINILNDEKLLFASSVVLGMNDALVEISGALAGFTLAINDSVKVGTLGLITGISAALSMAASEFLSRKQDDHDTPLINALYTGVAYIIVVSLLILPYFLISIPLVSMGVMIGTVIVIIFAFNYYISIAKKQPLFKNFITMALIALVVAAISFMIGLFVDSL